MCEIFFLFVTRGESLEDFDHVLDVVGCGSQLVVNFAHILGPALHSTQYSLSNIASDTQTRLLYQM